MMNYNPDTHQQMLLNDLADNVTSFQAIDQAVSVLIEWGLVDADFGAMYIDEIQKEKR